MNFSYHKRTFLRSFVAILLVAAPLMAFQFYTQYQIQRQAQHRLEEEVCQRAGSLAQNFDQELAGLENISLCIQNSSVLRAYNYDSKNLSLEMKNIMISEIGNLNKTNGLVDEILFCIKSNQTAYSSTGVYNLNTLIPSIYPFSAWSNTQFIYDINTARGPVWRKNERIISRGNYISLIYPIPLHNDTPYASILYLISEQNFKNKILSPVWPEAVVCVRNQSGEVIYTNASQTAFSEHSLKEGEVTCVQDLGGKAYCASLASSAKNGFQFAVYMPEEALFSDIAWGMRPWEEALWAVCLVLAAMLLAYLLCLPGKRAARRLSFLSGRPVKECADPDMVCRQMEQLQKINAQLRQKYDGAEQAVREYTYMEILQGKYESTSQVNSWVQEYGFAFRHHFYFVVNMQLSKTKEQLSNREWIGRLLAEEKKWAFQGYEYHIRDSYLPDIFFILFGCDNGDSRQIEKDLCGMRDIVSVLVEGDVSFGVGSICPEFKGITQSFLESCSVQKYQIIYGANHVLMSPLLASSHVLPQFYPTALVQKVADGFRMRSRDRAQNALRELNGHIRSTRYSPEMISLILSDIVSTVLKISRENLYGEGSGEQFSAFFARLCTLHTVDEMEAALLELAESFPDEESANPQRPTIEIASVYRYIEDHYCDYDFSVQNLSGHFCVSPSNMAHIFKRNTNSTIIDYVNKKRMERASDLLAKTDMTLKEIVKSIGFSDSSTFIKRFRTYYGMTPGQFKERNASKGAHS